MAKRSSRAWREYRADYLSRPDQASESARILTGAKVCSRLLAIGAVLCLATIAGRLFAGSADVSLGGVTLPLDFAWVGLLALTVAHAFTGAFLAHRITAYLPYLHLPEQALQVFREVTSSGNPFVFGMRSRALPRRPGGRYHPMSLRDPSAWVAYGAAVVLLLAVLPWRVEAGRIVVGGWAQVVLAVVLLAVNWWAGSVWMVSLSRLHYLGSELRDLPSGPLRRDELLRLLKPLESAYVEALSEVELYRLANLLQRFIQFPVPRTDVRLCIGPHSETRRQFRVQPRGLCVGHYQRIEATYLQVTAVGQPVVLSELSRGAGSSERIQRWSREGTDFSASEEIERWVSGLGQRWPRRSKLRGPKRDRWWRFVS
ncbi:hypothetical protein [Kribbella albertanoniae]|uniref:Uncharacterized protein n=1 Tax=Kribbella albertanoniae TaxID=1266829 RepID=A0A4R4PMX6_9ACTN|nr:hypothetical protein [Kribbella albertanoniae]TDC23482.1 hypothetical protein E1261_28340 [Kribbella albertanoniae]